MRDDYSEAFVGIDWKVRIGERRAILGETGEMRHTHAICNDGFLSNAYELPDGCRLSAPLFGAPPSLISRLPWLRIY